MVRLLRRFPNNSTVTVAAAKVMQTMPVVLFYQQLRM